MSAYAVHTTLHYDDGTVIASDVYTTEVDNVAVYTAELANVAGASYATTLAYDAEGYSTTYASYDGKWAVKAR